MHENKHVHKGLSCVLLSGQAKRLGEIPFFLNMIISSHDEISQQMLMVLC